MIISKGDVVEAHTTRRFRGNEGDIGEQKDVMITLAVEKTEIDKNAMRLRISGRIMAGKPEEFVTLGSYHTLNIAAQDEIDIHKDEWKDYILKRIKQAVLDSKKPRLGIIVMDDEKALVSYIKGYGIEIVSELYSRLSKRMTQKDFQKRRDEYFDDIINAVNGLGVDLVVLAGPGFTKDDVKKYMQDKGIRVSKQLIYASASDAERSGIREVMQGDAVAKVLENEHVKREFEYLNRLLGGIRSGAAPYGVDGVRSRLGTRDLSVVLVNDDIINDDEVKALLDEADKKGLKIEIFNSEDDAGVQLRNFKGIAAL